MKPRRFDRPLIVLLWCVCVFAFPSSAFSACEDLLRQSSTLVLERDELRQTHRELFSILAGKVPASVSASRTTALLPDSEEELVREVTRLKARVLRLDEVLELNSEQALCGDVAQRWLALVRAKQAAERSLVSLQLDLLQNSQHVRKVLIQALASWSRMSKLLDDLKKLEKDASLAPGLLQFSRSMRLEITDYRAALDGSLALVLAEDRRFQSIDQGWRLAMNMLSSSSLPISQTSLSAERAEAWLNTLNAEKRLLASLLSTWRHQDALNAGWMNFFSQLTQPADFFEGFILEVQAVPGNLVSLVSQPFINEYLQAVSESQGTQVLTSWMSQIFALLLLIFLLVKAAVHAAGWLANWQLALLNKLQNTAARSLVSGFFWLLKPNASWVFILVSANALNLIFLPSWTILNCLGPIATVYAAFRAVRIIIEWCLSRTFTRSGLFLSNQTAEQLVMDSRRVTWICFCTLGIWWLIYLSGGGYLVYLSSITALVVIWLLSWHLLHRHEVAVTKLTSSVLGALIKPDKEERSIYLNVLIKALWPFIFFLVHFIDVLNSLNQRLMVFDFYRSLSVKLLRARLESRIEEPTEEEGAEPDQSYSEWMLRDVADNILFDVGTVANVLDPMNKWFTDKSEENVMVILGESGSGKSTLVKRLPGIWQETPLRSLDIPPKVTDPQVLFDMLANVLGIETFTDVGGLVRQDEAAERQVIVLDSAQNLFLAGVGQFNAYKALLECMNAHLENIFWVVVMHAPSWTYLNYVFAREQRISNIYKMPRWSPMDIRKLILSRHHGGRRRLKYNEMLLSAAASSESSSVRAADSRVFNILWEQSGGNPQAAVELWLNAVKVKGRIAEVGVPQRPSSAPLSAFKDDLHFVYAAIVSHASLSTAELMLVTHFSEPVVRHALKQGLNLGMIMRDDSKRYKIDPYWYGALSGFLHRKNMLWD